MSLVVLIGPSGAGKTSLVDKYLANHPGAELHKSATTRPQRDSHDNAHDFMTDNQFDQAIAEGRFIQPVEVYGQRYALPHLPKQSDQLLFVLIRQQFVAPLKALYPDATVIQVEAALVTLTSRLASRSDRQRDTPEQLQAEIDAGRQVADHIIVNDGAIDASYQEFTKLCNHL